MFKQKKKSQRAATVLELLVSMFIVALLAALLIPASSSVLGTLDFLRCVSLRSELGQATINYAIDKFGENPPADSILPYNVDQLVAELKPYDITNDHFRCPAFERKMPGFAGEYHFIPTGPHARSLQQVDAFEYILYYEIHAIHGNGRVHVMGDGSARFLPEKGF